VSIRGNLVIGIASIVAGAVVIPYGASMPYVREGIPGPGLFPMIIGGMLIILGALVILTALMSARRDRIHGQQLAAAEAQAPPGAPGAPSAEAATAPTVTARPSADPPAQDQAPAVPTAAPLGADDGSGAAVPAAADDVAEEDVVTQAVMDTDIGSDGARRWINGAILMGSIVFYVVFA